MSNGNYVLVGLTGSGKSTTANCILNKSGQIENISKPFITYDGWEVCSQNFNIQHNEDKSLIILDTVGFGDPQFDPKFVLDNLRAGLARLDNQINCILFVDKKDRFTEQKVKFFELIQNEVFLGKCIKNSIMIVTNCKPGWLNKQTDPYLEKAVKICNNLSHEFYLKMDHDEDDNVTKVKNEKQRQDAIDSLISFIDQNQFQKISIDHIQITDCHQNRFKIIYEMILARFEPVPIIFAIASIALVAYLLR